MHSGILLIAHGSRDSAWATPFFAIQAQLAALKPECKVALSFLEHTLPTPAEAAQQLADAGCHSIRIIPLFLGIGQHAKADMQAVLSHLQTAFPTITCTLEAALGERSLFHPMVAQVLAQDSAI